MTNQKLSKCCSVVAIKSFENWFNKMNHLCSGCGRWCQIIDTPSEPRVAGVNLTAISSYYKKHCNKCRKTKIGNCKIHEISANNVYSGVGTSFAGGGSDIYNTPTPTLLTNEEVREGFEKEFTSLITKYGQNPKMRTALLSYSSKQKEEGMREERERIIQIITNQTGADLMDLYSESDDIISKKDLLTAITPSVGGDKEGE